MPPAFEHHSKPFSGCLKLLRRAHKLCAVGSIASLVITLGVICIYFVGCWLLFIYYYCLWETTKPGRLIKRNLSPASNCLGCECRRSPSECPRASFALICSQCLLLIRMSLGFSKMVEMCRGDCRSIALPRGSQLQSKH